MCVCARARVCVCVLVCPFIGECELVYSCMHVCVCVGVCAPIQTKIVPHNQKNFLLVTFNSYCIAQFIDGGKY